MSAAVSCGQIDNHPSSFFISQAVILGAAVVGMKADAMERDQGQLVGNKHLVIM